METVGLLVLGVAVGVLSALLGIGGGIVLVPALVILFKMSQKEAQGTSLATIPLGAIVAAVIYHQSANPLRGSVIVVVAAGFVVGAAVGARLMPYAPEAALRLAFGGLLFYLALLFLFDLRASHPVGLMLAPFTVVGGWMVRRLRGRPPAPEPPPGEHEYYI